MPHHDEHREVAGHSTDGRRGFQTVTGLLGVQRRAEEVRVLLGDSCGGSDLVFKLAVLG